MRKCLSVARMAPPGQNSENSDLEIRFGSFGILDFWIFGNLEVGFGIWNLEFWDFSVPKMAPPGQNPGNILVYLKWPPREKFPLS